MIVATISPASSHPQSPSPVQQQQGQAPTTTRRHSISSAPQPPTQELRQNTYTNDAQYVRNSIATNRTTVLTVCQGIKKDRDRVKSYIVHLGERLQSAEKAYQAMAVDIREATMEVIKIKCVREPFYASAVYL